MTFPRAALAPALTRHLTTAEHLAEHEALVTLPTRGDTPLHDALATNHDVMLRPSNVA